MAFQIEKLRRDHRVEGFDCGKEPLNRFLIRFALQSQLSNSAQTYLALSDASLIETCKLNGVDPQRYLTELLTRLVNGWPQARIDALMPWNCLAETDG